MPSFQFYISTILTLRRSFNSICIAVISILHKYDSHLTTSTFWPTLSRFQFYISTILTAHGCHWNKDRKQISILHKYDSHRLMQCGGCGEIWRFQFYISTILTVMFWNHYEANGISILLMDDSPAGLVVHFNST